MYLEAATRNLKGGNLVSAARDCIDFISKIGDPENELKTAYNKLDEALDGIIQNTEERFYGVLRAYFASKNPFKDKKQDLELKEPSIHRELAERHVNGKHYFSAASEYLCCIIQQEKSENLDKNFLREDYSTLINTLSKIDNIEVDVITLIRALIEYFDIQRNNLSNTQT